MIKTALFHERDEVDFYVYGLCVFFLSGKYCVRTNGKYNISVPVAIIKM